MLYRPENIDPGVRGRFAKEIALPVPDAPARTKILQLQTSQMTLSPTVDFSKLGAITPGFVGADLQAMVREAGMIAVSRIIRLASENQPSISATQTENDDDKMILTEGMEEIPQETLPGPVLAPSTPLKMDILSSSFLSAMPMAIDYSKVCVDMADFIQASKSIQPSAKREGFAIAPDVTWEDVGALAEIRQELHERLLNPISLPDLYKTFGSDIPAGILFFGPPGCGKTLLAKAIASESGANFISVKGPELLNMYVGESESKVRQVFARARSSAPCVIFFDELDALCPKRSSGFDKEGGNGVSERVVNQLLTELDGLETRRDVYVIGATNRPELIDDAMLRPGRLGTLLYVPLPNTNDRESILQALTRKIPIQFANEEYPLGVNLRKIAEDPRTEGFSGADLASLVREAGLQVIKEITSKIPNLGPSMVGKPTEGVPTPRIMAYHFHQALEKVKPSVNIKDRDR